MSSNNPFRTMYFAAMMVYGEVRIWEWCRLDDALATMRILVPKLHPSLDAKRVRLLAGAEGRYLQGDLPFDEFAALWLARTVHDKTIPNIRERDGMFDIDQAAKYATQLVTGTRTVWLAGEHEYWDGDFRSEFARGIAPLLLSPDTPSI